MSYRDFFGIEKKKLKEELTDSGRPVTNYRVTYSGVLKQESNTGYMSGARDQVDGQFDHKVTVHRPNEVELIFREAYDNYTRKGRMGWATGLDGFKVEIKAL